MPHLNFSKEAQSLIERLRKYENIEVVNVEANEWDRFKDDDESRKLRNEMCLMLMKSHLAQTKKPITSK